MSDFICEIQCDELTPYQPTEQDWAEYHAFLSEMESEHIVDELQEPSI